MNAEKFSEEVVRLGKPNVSSSQALRNSRAFMAALGIALPKQPFSYKLKPRIISRSAVGSQWVVDAGPYELTVSGQTGRILRFANIPALDAISKAQMFSHTSAFEGAVKPLISSPPSVCMTGKKSTLTRSGKVIGALRPSGTYIEFVDGIPVTNATDTVVFQFEPKKGIPILFSRALDFTIKPSAVQISLAQAKKIASKVPIAKLARVMELPESDNAPAEIGYFFDKPAHSDHSRYVGSVTQAVRCWTIRTKSLTIWIDASNGRFLAGVKLANP